MMNLRRALLLSLALSLAACGFHLRGHLEGGANFAFNSVYIKVPAQTPFIDELRQNIKINKLAVLPEAGQADLILEIVFERPEKQILALGASGRVIEYLLHYTVSLRAYDKQQREWLPAAEIHLQRDFPYDDTQILAKEQEEAMLYRDMRQDAVQQVLRRLSIAKPPQVQQ